eukprot:5697076-Prymnesium_polylepis.1
MGSGWREAGGDGGGQCGAGWAGGGDGRGAVWSEVGRWWVGGALCGTLGKVVGWRVPAGRSPPPA